MGQNQQRLKANTLLLLLILTKNTRRNKLNTYKDANQLKIAHNITQTGPRKSDKIAKKTKYFYYCIQTRLDNKDWILSLKITQLLEDQIKNAYLT